MLHLLESHGFIENGERVLEIGAGSGHLGLLLAYLFSHKGVTVTAVELSKVIDGPLILHSLSRTGQGKNSRNKQQKHTHTRNPQEKLALMRERAHQLRLRNFHVHPGSGSDYKGASQSNAIDLVVGLHACGPLTDLALDIAAESRAKFCLVPCCYGQLAEAPQIVDRIEAQNEVVPAATLVREYPRSERVGNWMSQAEFQSVARVADIGSSRPGNGQQRKRGMWIGELTPSCKSLINFDRAQRLLENDGFEVRFRELSPPTCSSKREVLLGAPPEK